MKIYHDGGSVLRVTRCPADLYVITNLGVVQNAVASKAVAQSFLDSWAIKHHMEARDDMDADMYDPGSRCPLGRMCIANTDGKCERLAGNNAAGMGAGGRAAGKV